MWDSNSDFVNILFFHCVYFDFFWWMKRCASSILQIRWNPFSGNEYQISKSTLTFDFSSAQLESCTSSSYDRWTIQIVNMNRNECFRGLWLLKLVDHSMWNKMTFFSNLIETNKWKKWSISIRFGRGKCFSTVFMVARNQFHSFVCVHPSLHLNCSS